MSESKPYFEAFNPFIIPFQSECMELLENWNYAESTLELLCSGAYGSSKSIVIAHYCVLHCLRNDGAVCFIGRRALPDLKKTFFLELCNHLITPSLKESTDYSIKETTAEITFFNGSKIISGSWADRRYMKFRSLNISMLVIEEAAENDMQDMQAFLTLKSRMRRLINRDGKTILGPAILITNPDEPDHWIYQYFCEGSKKFDTRRVLYSITTDNIFLDPVYVKQLLADLDPISARRYIYGEWISLRHEVLYPMYEPSRNESEKKYVINPAYPICITFDFNIAVGKPLSAAIFQYIEGHFHVFEESVIFTARTENTMDDMLERGLLSYPQSYEIYGDAAGSHKSTQSRRSDYDVVYEKLEAANVSYVRKVLPSNPPIRRRHNLINALCLNALGESHLTIYPPCKTLRRGLKLAKLKEGSNYVEEDGISAPFQHITTALGYAINAIKIGHARHSTSRSMV